MTQAFLGLVWISWKPFFMFVCASALPKSAFEANLAPTGSKMPSKRKPGTGAKAVKNRLRLESCKTSIFVLHTILWLVERCIKGSLSDRGMT